MNRQTEELTDRKKNGQTDTRMERQKEEWTNRQKNEQSDK